MIQLVDKYTPKTLADFIGIEKPKAIMSRFAADPYPSAWLFFGDSGLGKTSVAFALQKLIGGAVHHLGATTCTVEAVHDIKYKCSGWPFGGGRFHTFIIDEADSMSPAAQKAFLSVLDQTGLPDNAIFLFTANATNLLQPRFLSRVKTIVFEKPSDALIEAHLAAIAKAEGVKPSTLPLAEIVRSANSNIRDAINTLETELLVSGAFKTPQMELVKPPAPPPLAKLSEPVRATSIKPEAPKVAGVTGLRQQRGSIDQWLAQRRQA